LKVLIGTSSDIDQTLSQTAALVKALVSDLDKVGVPHLVATEASFTPTDILKRATVLSWNSKYDALFLAAGDDADRTAAQTRARRYTSYEVDFPPHETLHFGASVAAVYSFVRNPTFSAQTSGGQLTIAETAADYNKVTGAIALNITPDLVVRQFGAPHLEVGIAPDSTKFAIFGGVGLTFLSTAASNSSSTKATATGSSTSLFQGLEFNVGVIYQKATELAPGLFVGKSISTTQALSTNSVFKAGLYVGFGVKIK
jgi:hypothetical protein